MYCHTQGSFVCLCHSCTTVVTPPSTSPGSLFAAAYFSPNWNYKSSSFSVTTFMPTPLLSPILKLLTWAPCVPVSCRLLYILPVGCFLGAVSVQASELWVATWWWSILLVNSFRSVRFSFSWFKVSETPILYTPPCPIANFDLSVGFAALRRDASG